MRSSSSARWAGATLVALLLGVAVAAQSPSTARRSGDARQAATHGPSTLKAIRREVLPEALRVTLELEREAEYSEGSLDGPPRVFIDLKDTVTVQQLKNAALPFEDDVVRQIRVGHHAGSRTRVVMDLTGTPRHSVYALYEPYRVIIDFERPLSAQRLATNAASPAETGVARVSAPAAAASSAAPAAPPASDEPAEAPAPPTANGKGGFSLSRQLGLGVARIVIDPGHGGRDPGAQVRGLSEADLVLDISLRLAKLLAEQPGVDVVLTRERDDYVSLEARTALANQSMADVFLSIHANASANPRAVGIETYFLNFARNAQAEATAARENAGSARTMNELADIVRSIASNNKRDESRDLAAAVQSAMYGGLRRVNRDLRNLGVKQAPFTVLVGASMPGLLAEIGFMTHKQEGALLKTERYRQQVAEALATGVLNYQRALKASKTVATQ